jgi:hypothetical protein
VAVDGDGDGEGLAATAATNETKVAELGDLEE